MKPKQYWKYLERVNRVSEMYLNTRHLKDTLARTDYFMQKIADIVDEYRQQREKEREVT